MKKSFSIVALLTAAFLLCADNLPGSIWKLPAPFCDFDKDGDNVLSGGEIAEENLRFDLNKDGFIVPSEVLFLQAKESFEKQFSDYERPLLKPVKVDSKAGKKQYKNAILISIDGLDRKVFMELLQSNQLPNIKRLATQNNSEPVFLNSQIIDHQTETKPGHAAMLTGVGPEVNFVLSNSQFQPIPKGLTIHERLEDNLGEENIYTIFVSSKAENVGAKNAEELGNREVDGIPIVGAPYFNAKKSIDYFSAEDRPTVLAKREFIEALNSVPNKPFFGFLHFRNPDKAGHSYGRESKSFRKKTIEVDSAIGDILDELKSLGADKDTRIFVTADHGFVPKARNHFFAPWIFLASNDPSICKEGRESIVNYDVSATIIAGFGIDISKLRPKLRGVDLSE